MQIPEPPAEAHQGSLVRGLEQPVAGWPVLWLALRRPQTPLLLPSGHLQGGCGGGIEVMLGLRNRDLYSRGRSGYTAVSGLRVTEASTESLTCAITPGDS